ncbi:MAG: hypothetical protein HBSAPP02_20460 [Phycisphaerae bacterium]|nr:MAG: hypothetical protein HBSAPP02_20460 [Phycisphaerae bacterium]
MKHPLSPRMFILLLLALPALTGMDCQGNPAVPFVPMYSLRASISGQGTVERVTADGSVSFTDGNFAEGSTVTLRALPAEGWHFVRWEGAASTSDAQIALTVEQDQAVTAVFVAVAGHRTVTIQGIIGRITLAVRNGQVRGNFRSSNLGTDIEGTVIGDQLSLTSTAPGFSNASIQASIQPDGSLLGTINGSGFSNSPWMADPVTLFGFEDDASGQRTTALDGFNGIMTIVVSEGVLRGTWRMFASYGADLEGVVSENQVTFSVATPGFTTATVTASILPDGSWAGTINGSGYNNAAFSAQPSFFP